MEVSVCSLWVPSGFSGRVGSEVSMGYIFPPPPSPRCTDGYHTGEVWDGDEGAGARTKCKPGLLWSLAFTILSGLGLEPTMMEQQHWHSGSSCSVDSQVCALSLGIFTFTLVESSAGLRGAGVAHAVRNSVLWDGPSMPVGTLGHFLYTVFVSFMKWLPSLHSEVGQGPRWLCFLQVQLPSLPIAPSPWWGAALEQRRLERSSGEGWGSPREPARIPGNFQSASFTFFLGVSKCVCMFFLRGVSVLHSPLLSPIGLKPAERTWSWTLGLECPIFGSNFSLLREDFQDILVISSSPSLSPDRGTVLNWSHLLLYYQTPCASFFTALL